MGKERYDQAGGGKTPAEHLQTGCHAAVHAVLEEDLDASEKAEKIRAILVAHEKLVGKLGQDQAVGPNGPQKKGDALFGESVQLILKLGRGQRHVGERRRAVPKQLDFRGFARFLRS